MSIQRAVLINPKWQGDALQHDAGSLYFRKRIQFTDFSAAATTVNLDTQAGQGVWTLFPEGLEIEGAGISLVTNFTGGAVSAATLSIGTTGSVAAYVAATSVFSGAYKKVIGVALVPFTFLEGTGAPAVSTVRVQLITTTANANALTAGKADIYLKLRAVSVKTNCSAYKESFRCLHGAKPPCRL